MNDDFPMGKTITIDSVSPFIKKMKVELLQRELYENFDNKYLHQVVEVIQGVITSRNNMEVVQQTNPDEGYIVMSGINKTRAKFLLKESRHYLNSDLFNFIGRSQLRELFRFEGTSFLYETLSDSEKEILGRELNEKLTKTK